MVRVRFAPSPTGLVHVGSLRTALYNYLFAKHHKGTLVLRIEDTDRTRFVEGAVDNLLRTMNWAGIHFDEGPVQGGQYGPYVQSERFDRYNAYGQQLVASGHAYRCFCTAERIDLVRKTLQESGQPPMYDGYCRGLSADEIAQKEAEGLPHVIRLKVPAKETVFFDDLVRNRVVFQSHTIDDQVLIKSDGFPTYHLANVVDDHDMNITHVIRGEEWLSSTPKHVLLYKAFGWDIPQFAHLPLLLNPDRSKLSKRQGDVSVEDFQAHGFLPEALVNFVALLGWNPSDKQEIYTLDELIEKFDISKVNKAGAVFDQKKLLWMNGQYIRKMPPEALYAAVKPHFNEATAEYFNATNISLAERMVNSIKDNLEHVSDINTYVSVYLLSDEDVAKAWLPENQGDTEKQVVAALLNEFEGYSEFSAQQIETGIQKVLETLQLGKGKVLKPLRYALTARPSGPHLPELMSILGPITVCNRLKRFVG